MAPAKLCKGAAREEEESVLLWAFKEGEVRWETLKAAALMKDSNYFSIVYLGSGLPLLPLLRSPALDSHFGNSEAIVPLLFESLLCSAAAASSTNLDHCQ